MRRVVSQSGLHGIDSFNKGGATVGMSRVDDHLAKEGP